MRANRLAGHTLPNEGAIYDGVYIVSRGSTRCSCGVESPPLPSDNARRKWHRDHKDTIRAQEATDA